MYCFAVKGQKNLLSRDLIPLRGSNNFQTSPLAPTRIYLQRMFLVSQALTEIGTCVCVVCWGGGGGSSVDLTLGTVGTGTHHIPTTPNHITRGSREKEDTIDERPSTYYFIEGRVGRVLSCP